jgi:threonine/homoserine/homoserine lactone efflux protein
MIDHQAAFRLVGALLLIALGVNSLHAFVVVSRVGSGSPTVPAPVRGRLAAFASTFALTAVNPITFVSFVGVIAAIGPATAGAAFALVVGVFLGSMLWWTTLVMFVRWAHRFVPTERLRWIDLVTGVLLASIGGYLGLAVSHAWRA